MNAGVMKKRVMLLVSGMLVLVWMVFIFCMSSKNSADSTQISNGVTAFLQRLFFSQWAELGNAEFEERMSGFHYLIRKAAHFLEFTVLGALLAYFIRQFRLKNGAVFALSFGAGVLYAFLDELHQFFVPGRSMETFDVCVDAAGVFFGIMICFAVLYLLNGRRTQKG